MVVGPTEIGVNPLRMLWIDLFGSLELSHRLDESAQQDEGARHLRQKSRMVGIDGSRLFVFGEGLVELSPVKVGDRQAPMDVVVGSIQREAPQRCRQGL